MTTTVARRVVAAPRSAVYAVLVDPELGARWRVPAAMTCHVHVFEPVEGGRVRVSLTYDLPDGSHPAGKSSARTDTYRGTVVRLVPDELYVEDDAFETDDPALQAPMRMTVRLQDVPGGTEVVGVQEGVPEAVSAADNDAGWREALDRLAALVEQRPRDR